MAQVLFATDTTPSLVDLDANTKEGGYRLGELFSTTAYSTYSAYTAPFQKFLIDATKGVFSLNTTIYNWRANASALQVGSFCSVWTQSNGAANIGFALYESGTNTFAYATTGDVPALYSVITGAHIFYRAASSGTANAAVTLIENGRWDASGNFLLTGSGSMGYGTGSGGAVTQATSKSTGVTLNKSNGQITMNAASLAASTAVSFTLTNSTIAATDQPDVAIASGATAGAYVAEVDAVSAGSCRISLRNLTGGALAEAVVLNFVNTKAVAA